MFNCPKANALIAQLTDEDVKLTESKIQEVLKKALTKKLEQFPYGSLQLDMDRALQACVASIEKVDYEEICSKQTCEKKETDDLVISLSKLGSCDYHFMADTVNTIAEAAKSDPSVKVSDVKRVNLHRTILSIAKTLPSRMIALGIKTNESLLEKTSINCRTNLKKLLGLPLTELDGKIAETVETNMSDSKVDECN